jgi:hypothetical protein
VSNGAESYSWIGHLLDDEFSQVILTVSGDWMMGSIISSEGVYTIEHIQGRLHAISELDTSAFLEGDDVTKVSAAELQVAAAENSAAEADDGSVIDVLVVYTNDARDDGNPGTNVDQERQRMRVFIDTAINQTNTTFRTSLVETRVRLAGVAEVAYAETFNSVRDLDNLRNGRGGLDIVSGLRFSYAADVVSMIVSNYNDVCGRAYQIMESVTTSFRTNAFNVVDEGCAVANLTFAHELGHLMGARHDWYDDDTNNRPYSFNHGFVVNTTITITNPWRTIMATNAECGDQTPAVNCTRLAHWSNPRIFYFSNRMGVPAGTGTGCTAGNLNNPDCDADEHQTINNTRWTVANFVPGNQPIVSVGPECTGAFNCYRTVTAAAFRVAPNGVVSILPGSYPETFVLQTQTPGGLTLDRPMELRASNGTVTIGQ